MINIDDRLLPTVNESEMWLLLHLGKRLGNSMSAFPSNKTLLEDTGWHIEKLQRVKTSLVEKRILKVKIRKNTSNLYTIKTDFLGVYISGKGQSVEVEESPSENPVYPPRENRQPSPGKTDNEVLTTEVLTIDQNTPLPPLGDGRVRDEDVFEKEINTNTMAGPRPEEADLQDRMVEFRRHVHSVGGTIYTQKMLDNFIAYYSQPDGAKKPKMNWEKKRQKRGWDTASQLKAWATRNIDGIQCYLTSEQKTIAEKRQAFAKSLEPYMQQYGREFLLDFYRYWSVPENVMNPQFLRWEKEEFWELATRLADRFSKWNKPKY